MQAVDLLRLLIGVKSDDYKGLKRKSKQKKISKKRVKQEMSDDQTMITLVSTPEFYCPQATEKKQTIDLILQEFHNDNTFYDLTDKSEDEDENDDANYDSKYFCKVDVSGIKPKKRSLSATTCTKNRVITLKKKCIARWAENKEKINEIIEYQNKEIKADSIFGPLIPNSISLSEVFDSKKRYEQRGSSANWKNEYWTPNTAERQNHKQRMLKDFKQNLEEKFALLV